MKIRFHGVHGQFVFNGNKFSYKAAFEQSERQLQSAGTFTLGGGIYNIKIESDSVIEGYNESIIRNFQFGISGGYAYTWVLNNNWYVSGSISMGVHFGNEVFNQIGKKNIEVYPTVFPRISVGYNRDSWSLGLSYINNFVYTSFFTNANTGLLSGGIKITYTKRLTSFPILSKIFN